MFKHTSITLIFIILFPFAAFCQDTTYLNKSYSPSARESASYYEVSDTYQGVFRKRVYRLDGIQISLRSFQTEKGEVKEGLFEDYHDDGSLRRRMTYQNGKLAGMYETFHKNGRPHLRGRYEGGKETGPWLSFYQNGVLETKKIYPGGTANITIEGYYPNERLQYKGHYLDEIFHLDEAFDSTGQAILPGGKGEYISYHDSTEDIFQRGSYSNGLREGEWLFFEKGKKTPALKVNFKEGKVQGNIIYVDSTGSPFLEESPLGARDLGNIDASLSINPTATNLDSVRIAIGYPGIARDAGIQGEVLVRVLVDKSGRMINHRVLGGHPILVRAVERQLYKLRFTPAIQHSLPIRFYVNIPFNFELIENNRFERKKRKKKNRKNKDR